MAVFSRHVLHLDAGYAILSWPGTIFVGVGLYKMIKDVLSGRL
jgi:hypothetical protein